MIGKIKTYSIRVFDYAKNHKKVSVVAIAIFILLFYFFVIKGSSKQVQYQTAQVSRGTIISTVSESGNVTGNETDVESPTNGVITALYVKNGNEVKKGDPLFHVESTATEDQKKSAYAAYLASQNTYNADNANLYSLQSTMFSKWNTYYNLAISSLYQNSDGSPNTATRVAPQFTTAQDDWLASEANYKNQQGVLAKDQASLSQALLAYNETQDVTVNAPVSGTVANLAATVGTNVNTTTSNSTTTTSGTVLLNIGNFSNSQVKVQISEVDVPNIKEGQKAIITLDAFPGKTFVGRVASVDTVGTISSGVVTYNAYVDFVSLPPEVKPSMTASAIIQTQRKDNALTVPTSAIQTTNGTSTVRVVQNGKISQVTVETGIVSDNETEITSGLNGEETVVIGTISSTTTSQSSSPFSSFGGRGFGGGAAIRGGGR